MSKLKKLVLLSIVLFLIVPVIMMLYSVLLFGNTPTGNQWVSAIVLSSLGMVIMVIVSLEMNWNE